MYYQLIQPQLLFPLPKRDKIVIPTESPSNRGNPENPSLSPNKEVPFPDEEEEISPNPILPEEEEYLPDEQEINDDPLRKKEIEDPYQPRREEQFPPKKEPGFPRTDPDI